MLLSDYFLHSDINRTKIDPSFFLIIIIFTMEVRIIFHTLSMFSVGIFQTAAPAAASASTRYSRPKRCSCATFLDKECVYFCHLDIIWVNTPERTVSYGLGNARRKKRSTQQTSRATELLRCVCADSTDGKCVSFCRTRKPPRRKAARDKVIPTAGGGDRAEMKFKYELAAKTSGIKWDRKRAEPIVVRHLKLLLKKWRMRLSHNTQN